MRQGVPTSARRLTLAVCGYFFIHTLISTAIDTSISELSNVYTLERLIFIIGFIYFETKIVIRVNVQCYVMVFDSWNNMGSQPSQSKRICKLEDSVNPIFGPLEGHFHTDGPHISAKRYSWATAETRDCVPQPRFSVATSRASPIRLPANIFSGQLVTSGFLLRL